MNRIHLTILMLLGTITADAAPSTRARDFTEAMEIAKSSGNDIVVFQRGSDWNRLGEQLYRDVWQQAAFLKALGDGFVLTAVDRQEQTGAPALGASGDAGMITRFNAAVAPGSRLPDSTITNIAAASGASYRRRDDGAMVVDDPENKNNPAGDTITFTVAAPVGGQLLRLDFPVAATNPNGCAGRASNGNFFINEVEVAAGGQPIAIGSVWASATEGGWDVRQAVDGIKDQPANGWNPAAHLRQPRTLILAFATPVRSAGNLTVTLTCMAQWQRHVPGCFRAAVLADPQLAGAVARIDAANALNARNAAYSWWDTSICPRVALLDCQGRAIASDDTPRATLTPATLADRVKDLRARREARDALFAKADLVQGPEKAELLRQGLAVLGFFNWAGNGNCYQPVHARIKEADPKDISGATRWLGFSADPKGGVPWAKPAWNEALDTQGGKRVLVDADYQEALARVDKEIADPRNKILSRENIQRMMVAKFHIFRSWKGHEDERFRIQHEIAAFDPTTFWGIGAIGYCGMYGKSPTPFLTYGWKPGQLKAGSNQWRLPDTANFFDHPGHYKITVSHAGGADTLKLTRLALMDGKTEIAGAQPAGDLGPGRLAKSEVILDCTAWKPDRHYDFLVDLEAGEGHTDVHGRFTVEPWIVEPAAKAAARIPDYFTIQAELQRKLLAAFAGKSDALAQAIASSSAARKDLARHELIRRCGANTLNQIASRHGGSAFLGEFTGDVAWMESFLANDECSWPQAIENLRFLHANAMGKLVSNLLYRKVATAIALAAGEMNRYRMLDRYHHIVRVHRDGLMHASFDQLTVREMRWAILLTGTAADFQYIVDATQVRLGDYLGSCWGIAYIDPNVYGYSVQGWGYADPWTHHFGTGTGDRPFRAQRLVGGVCGTLSGYGASCARAHGVMSTTVGQPGHCAYVVRIGREWPTGYDVCGPETNGASVFEGTGFATMNRLYEVIHADPSAYLQAARLSWAAHAIHDHHKAAVRILPDLEFSVYKLPGGNIAGLANLQAVKSGRAGDFNLAPLLPPDTTNFGIVWNGRMEILGSGPLMVQLPADDSARLIIDKQVVACNQAPAMITLPPGTYPVRLEYGQAGGAHALAVNWTSAPPWNADWSSAWTQALAAQPINFGLWLEYIKSLEASPGVPATVWQNLIATIAPAFSPYHEAGWALVNRCYAKLAPDLQARERMELLLRCHQCLTQSKAPLFMGYNLGAVLNSQADSLGDPALAVEYFGRLLQIHHSPDPGTNRVFGDVMNWGNTRFAANPATSALYANAIASFFAKHGKDTDPNQLRTQITAGIRKASEIADAPAYQLWTTMAAKLLPACQPGDIHLNAREFAGPPKVTPFPGILLGKDGLLQTSSACQYDRPLTYPAILDGSTPGYFDTNNEEKPWAQIALAGDSDISGIVLVNRYELAPTHEEFLWAAPLKVFTSPDGKAWTEVATCDKADQVMSVDLAGKATRARYIRIERQIVDKAKPPRLHFRNFLVYGRKLY